MVGDESEGGTEGAENAGRRESVEHGAGREGNGNTKRAGRGEHAERQGDGMNRKRKTRRDITRGIRVVSKCCHVAASL